MDSRETHQQQNRNAAALTGANSTSQAMHNRSYVGDLSLLPPQPQPQQRALMLDASPYPVSTQPQWRYLGIEKRGPPDVIDGGDSGGGANANDSSSDPPAKRGRGRPPGSRTKQQRKALGAGGAGGKGGALTAHVIDVNAGEDIAMKLLEFIDQEPRDVCILSASGAVSTAALRSNNPRELIIYEGLFVIIHMSMSSISLRTESNDGSLTRNASLKVSLAGPDCMVVGGCVGGKLVAFSQVQIIVGTFELEREKLSAASSVPANVLSSSDGGGGPGLPQSQGPQGSSVSSEKSDGKSPFGNTTPQPPHHSNLWPGYNPQ
ncbi:hypothetical protein N665_0176s0034 [Sinapis alba]|nr:hypothetical protein N665_0176s0034 [Sinapis alba]